MVLSIGDISAADWGKGIALSILASLIGGASKLVIRKSWLLVHDHDVEPETLAIEAASADALTLDTNSASSNEGSVSDASEDLTRKRRRQRRMAQTLRYFGMIGMAILNPICCVLAMKYASPSILAPFSGLTMVWVILFSNLVVGEKPSNAQKMASGLIIIGEVIVACFGDHTNDVNVTEEDVLNSYKNPYFLAYFVVLCCYLALLAYWINFSQNPILRRFAWGSCGGSTTGLQNFLKDSLTLFKVSTGPVVWALPFFVFMAAATAFSGLIMLTACMKRYDATYSAASFVGSFVISASIMSAVHYQTFQSLISLWNYILYPFGLLVLMVGVFILVRESRESDEEESEEGIDEVVPVRKDSEDSQIPFMYTKVDDDGELNEIREV